MAFLPRAAHPRLIIPSALLLWPVFSYRGLLSAAREILTALEAGDLEEARRLTGWHLVSRRVDSLREDEICGCVIESLAENLTDSFTSPLLFFLLLGLPGAWGLRFINTCDALIGYRDPEHLWGGRPPPVWTIFSIGFPPG